ncbi:MAG TPA: hypothetical protein VHD90_26075 [Phototrophicaceae bacterium]|nr:hypothetical protein [Phototrophicaceae bacterium]
MSRSKIILLTVVLMALLSGAVQAASSGDIHFDGTGNTEAETCDLANLNYHYSFTANTDDGGGSDYVAVVIVDAYGTPLDVDYLSFPLGPVSGSDFANFSWINSISSRPATIALFDIGNPGSIDENTVAGFNFAISGTLLSQDSFDPANVASPCSELPLLSPFLFSSGSKAAYCPPIPDGSVMGALPNRTQAFYEPGNLAPEVFLNPGTYWVIGEDQGEQYYKIRLACQDLWVPIAALQPSWQSPWNGQTLPTRITP